MNQPQEEPREYRQKLSAADAARMARLSEEVRGRLEEMAAITSRVIGVPLDPDAVRKFVPHQPSEARSLDSPTVVEVEILDGFLGPGTRPCCLVALSDGDWFVECPCGAADSPGG